MSALYNTLIGYLTFISICLSICSVCIVLLVILSVKDRKHHNGSK